MQGSFAGATVASPWRMILSVVDVDRVHDDRAVQRARRLAGLDADIACVGQAPPE